MRRENHRRSFDKLQFFEISGSPDLAYETSVRQYGLSSARVC